MAKIICPNKEYSGISASVTFVNGVGESDNEHLLKWFSNRGYTVEGWTPKPEVDSETDNKAKEDPKTQTNKRK